MAKSKNAPKGTKRRRADGQIGGLFCEPTYVRTPNTLAPPSKVRIRAARKRTRKRVAEILRAFYFKKGRYYNRVTMTCLRVLDREQACSCLSEVMTRQVLTGEIRVSPRILELMFEFKRKIKTRAIRPIVRKK